MGSNVKFIQNAFTSGELTPRLTARDDYNRYANGVKTMLNFFPLPHGGARTRYGTRFVARTKENTANVVLIPFEISTPQAYLIEAGAIAAGAGYFRFYKNGARINDLTGTITGAANNGSGLIRITDVAHGLATGNYVEITDVLGTVEANNEWKVTVIDANTFDLDGSAFTNTYISGGTWSRPYEISTDYGTTNHPRDIRWAQAGDILYLVHPLVPPSKLTRTSDTSWTILKFTGADNFIDGPYMDENIVTSKTLTPSVTAVGAAGTLTAAGFTPWTGAESQYAGSIYRIKVATTWGYVRLTTKVSSTVFNMVVMLVLDGTTATSTWREGSFSVERGYPRTCTIFEQRLALAGTSAEPQTLWLSTTGSYEDFSPSAVNGTIAADDGVTYRLGSSQLNKIHWVQGARDLVIGTIGAEFSMKGAGDGALSPTNAPIVRSGTVYGTSKTRPVRAGSNVYFMQRSERKFRSLQYDFNSDTYISPDISLSAEHLFRDYTVSLPTFQLEPDSIVWLVRSDGTLLSFTIHELEQVYGWAQHKTNGKFKQLAVIPSADLASDTLWTIVERTVGGATKHYVEYFDPTLDVDSAVTYTGTNVYTLTPGATTGNGVTFTASGSIFASTDVGKQLILLAHIVNGVAWYSRATIKTFVSATEVTADIVANFPNTSAVPAGSWGIGITQITNAYHLNGLTAAVVGDDAVYDNQVVSGGVVDLEYGETSGPHAALIQIGLARTPNPKIETLQPAFRDDAGTVRNKWKHWATAEVSLENTVGLTINGATQIQYRTPSDPMDVGPPQFTGEKAIPLRHTTKDGRLTFEQELPLPATLLSYFGELETGD